MAPKRAAQGAAPGPQPPARRGRGRPPASPPSAPSPPTAPAVDTTIRPEATSAAATLPSIVSPPSISHPPIVIDTEPIVASTTATTPDTTLSRTPTFGRDRSSDKISLALFSGDPREDPQSWLADLDFKINPTGLRALDDESVLLLVDRHLTGIAHDWFRAIPAANRPTYLAWRELFVARFATSQTARDAAMQQLFQRRQGETETIHDFVSSTVKLCMRANPTMPVAEQINYLTPKVFDPDLITVLGSRRPETIVDFVNIATEHLTRKAAHARTRVSLPPARVYPPRPPPAYNTAAPTPLVIPAPETVLRSPPGPTQPVRPVPAHVNSAPPPSAPQTVGPRTAAVPAGAKVCYNCGETTHLRRTCPYALINKGFDFAPPKNFQ